MIRNLLLSSEVRILVEDVTVAENHVAIDDGTSTKFLYITLESRPWLFYFLFVHRFRMQF
jgi:hypothetical protein